jgi:hypothetical protein
MKINYFLTALALCFCTQLTSQIQKGKVLIGSSSNLVGSFGLLAGNVPTNAGIWFGKEKSTYQDASGNRLEIEANTTVFNINPTFGTFVSDRLLVGASGGIFRYVAELNGEKFKFTTVSLAPMMRGYIKKEGSILPFAELRGGLYWIIDEEDSDAVPFYEVKGGASFFLHRHISLDLFANAYGASEKNVEDDVETASKFMYLGLGLGLNVFLSPREKAGK